MNDFNTPMQKRYLGWEDGGTPLKERVPLLGITTRKKAFSHKVSTKSLILVLVQEVY